MSYRVIFLLAFVGIFQSVTAQSVRLGIVTDFEKVPVLDSVFQTFANEIDRTTGSSRKVTLNTQHIRYNVKDFRTAGQFYNEVTSQVDFVLLVGSVSIKGVLNSESIIKPTIGLGVIDPNLQEFPYSNGRSKKANFSYIWETKDFSEELTRFSGLHKFQNLAVLVDGVSALTFNQEKARKVLDSLAQDFGATINIVPVTADIPGSINNLPEETDAVYLTVMYGKGEDDIRTIANEINKRKLPSFSGSKFHVDEGILACISDENDLDQITRKLAIMVDEALSGSSLAEMPVAINNKRDFYLNYSTARAIDFSPPFEVLFTANIIDGNDKVLPTYSLKEVVQKALEVNFDVKITQKDIEAAEQDLRVARSGVQPNVNLGVNGVQINSQQANAAFGRPERQVSGQLSLSQVIYSEEAIAGIKIAQYVKKAQEHTTRQQILNVLLDTYNGYFNVLAAKTNAIIREENFNNTKKNLELAKVRVDLGSASNADLYRWESEVATAMQAVVEAQTNLLKAKLQLNNFLANTLEDDFEVEDVTLDDDVYEDYWNGPIAGFIKTPDDFGKATDFMVSEALSNSPNKRSLLENIKLTERQRLQNQRLLYTPNIALQAQTNQILKRGGIGSTEVPGGPKFRNNSWQVGVSLTYPLFRGNARRANLQKSTVQLEKLNYSREKLDQGLELSVRSGSLDLLNTGTNILFSETASDNAKKNFELIQENYKQGLVSITQLIDAQQSALQANQNYALSIYNYMQAYLRLEYSMGFFSALATAQETADFKDRFIQFIANN